jgi:gliding motility-associated-like protein
VHGTLDSAEVDGIEHHHAFRFRFLGSNETDQFIPSEPYTHHVNYFLGNDPSRWRSEIRPSRELSMREIYNGIDLKLIESQGNLIYEFHLAPGAKPSDIRIKMEGIDNLHTDRYGNLVLPTSIAEILESKPMVYQIKGDRRWDIPAEFVIAGNTVSYAIESYDTNLSLVIDPELIFSTFSGSTTDNWGYTATPDKDGFAYTGSATYGNGYPTTTGAYDVTFGGPELFFPVPGDVTLSKYDTTGTSLIYSTYLGGDSVDIPQSMIVDDEGHLFVFGTTGSRNFPTTSNAVDGTFNGGNPVTPSFVMYYEQGADIFVTKFTVNGSSLLSSTFLGGTGTDGLNMADQLVYNYADEARGEINLDLDNNVIIVSSTSSTDFPGTSGSFQSTKADLQDGVIVKLNSSLSQILWSSYIGGLGNDAVFGVAIAQDNSLYITGGTSSSDFPVRTGAFQSNNAGGSCDAFLSHISADGKTLIHSTFFGTSSYDQMFLIQLDRDDHPHVFGQTEHSGGQYIFNAAFNNTGGGQVLAHFRPDLGSRVWSTQFGSSPGVPNISPTAFLVDKCNSLYLAGWGGNLRGIAGNSSSDVQGLPTTSNAIKSTTDAGRGDFYLCVLDADANTQTYGSFYGGNQGFLSANEHVDGGTSRFDRAGKIYQAVCAGCGGQDNFPTYPDPGAWSNTNNSINCNSAIFKIDFDLPVIIADFEIPEIGCAPFTTKIKNTSVIQNATTYLWLLDGNQFSTIQNPTRTFTNSGTYTITLIISDPNSCNLHDTIEKSIQIKSDTSYALPTYFVCVGQPVMIGPNPDDFPDYDKINIIWSPSNPLSNDKILNPIATVKNDLNFILSIGYLDGGCVEQILIKIDVDKFDIFTSNDTIVCSTFTPFTVSGDADAPNATYAWSDKGDFSNILSTDKTVLLNGDNLTRAINNFYFKATKPNGCSMMDTVQVTVSDYDIKLTNDTSICQDGTARIEALSQNPKNTFYYYWTLNGFYSPDNQDLLTDTNQNYLEVSDRPSQTYYLQAISNVVFGCSMSDSVRVKVSSLSKSAVSATASKDTFYLGETVQLFGTPSDGYYHGWTPSTFLSDSSLANPTVQAKKAMTYTYTVSDRDTPICEFSDTVSIRPYEIICGEPEVFLPTAFTPNGDGMNDELKIYGRYLKSVELAVYDRWGKAVFQTNDKDFSWDGTYKGETVGNAVYVFYYEARCIDEQRIFRKGNITIVGD